VNGLLLGYLFCASGLVPRWIAMCGVVGGPLIFASAIAVLFGAYEQDGAHFLLSIPEIVFESRAPDRRLGCRLEPVELEIDMDAEQGTPSTRKRGWLPATRHIQRA
jgi:uncharacterized protein DUF4386